MSKKPINRREFLISTATAAGVAWPGMAWTASPGRPCPPPTVTVERGTTASTECAPASPGRLPKLMLTSTVDSGTYAWTFGHAFRQGDVPAGSFITGDGGMFQAAVRNYWPDGSAKYAVLSGIGNFSSRAPKSITLGVASAIASGPNVPEPTTLDASVTFSGALTGTHTLQSVLGVGKENWNGKAGGGRVRQVLGPVMSEFHYYLPTADDHVAVWFYVRRYANGATEVETVVENGWLMVPSPAQKDYSVTVSVGGTTRYSGSLSHLHHTRWSRVDWLGVDPQIVPRHDPSYLRQTGLVPNYGYTSPTDAAFSGFATDLNPPPFARGNWPSTMGATGYSPSIGLLPKWEALYCTSGDPRAYAAMISNARGAGRYPIYYRDETTGRVPLYASYSKMSLTSGWGTSPPKPSGGTVYWAITHHPSVGYLAYLVTGRWPMLEMLEFSAAVAILEASPSTRQNAGVLACLNAPLTTRGVAWAWRTMGQAAGLAPTRLGGASAPDLDVAIQRQFARSIGDTASWLRKRFVDGTIDNGVHRNTIGWLGHYDGGTPDEAPAARWGMAWMERFQSLALGHISNVGIENLDRPEDLVVVRNHSYEGTLQLVGDNTTWNWRRLALYLKPYLKGGTTPLEPVFLTVPQAYAAYRERYGLAEIPADPGGTLKAGASDNDLRSGDSSNLANGYGALAVAVLGMAVEHGRPGAAAKLGLVRAAPNFDPERAGAHNDPTWAIVPR